MSSSITQIQAELESLGYQTSLLKTPQGEAVTFRYQVEAGSHKGKYFTVGIGMRGSELYPEYPPHWIHLTPPLDDGKGGSIAKYSGEDDREWIAMSRPPGPMWDRVPTKNMDAYLKEHLRCFWNNM
ncbi:MAG: hypothetical protein OXU40_04800 [Nitrospira sp.]|nr:hypothetical protein [Nitrospira sp.]